MTTDNTNALPLFRCHKEVRAAKIVRIERSAEHNQCVLSLEFGDCGITVLVLDDWLCRNSPQVGGYFVVYADGYQSYSPAQAFEEGYSRITDEPGYSSAEVFTSVASWAQAHSKKDIAPKVTPADVEASIVSEHYFTAAQGDAKSLEDAAFVGGSLNGEALRPVPESLGLVTFCLLVLRNGTKVVGINHGPVSAENFDAAYGRRDAREQAVEQIWPLLGYQLREQLYQSTQPALAPE